MKQNNKNISNVSHPNYNPAEDPEVEPDVPLVSHTLNKIRGRFMPYQRYIMIVGFIILVMLVVFLGYARGALDVCNDLDGRLEVGWKIKCHPSHYNQTPTVNIIPLVYIPSNNSVED